MGFTKTYIGQVKKYIESTGIYKQNGLFEAKDPHDNSVTVFATNGVSLIWFSPFGDDEPITGNDFTGIDIKDGAGIRYGKVWEHVVYPYYNDFSWNYEEKPIKVNLSELRKDVDDIKIANDIPVKTKLYDTSLHTRKIDVRFGGFYVIPELVYDVGKIVGKSEVELYVPKRNPYHPLVIVGENKYGSHLGFVLGTGKNVKKFANK